MAEQVERFPLGRLISDNYWSFCDGYQIYRYVVWVTPEEIYKYREVDENGNIIGTPGINDIQYF